MERTETVEYRGYTISIRNDMDPMNPREEFDHLGTMICFHGRYKLGDKHDYQPNEFSGWDDLEAYIYEELDAVVCLSLYLYDHSGLVMKTGPFSCPWDSGQVGFIFCTPEDIKERFSVDLIDGDILKRAKTALEHEVNEYSSYLGGFTYGFMVNDKEGKHVDECYGFYGLDFEENGLMEMAKESIDYDIESM